MLWRRGQENVGKTLGNVFRIIDAIKFIDGFMHCLIKVKYNKKKMK